MWCLKAIKRPALTGQASIFDMKIFLVICLCKQSFIVGSDPRFMIYVTHFALKKTMDMLEKHSIFLQFSHVPESGMSVVLLTQRATNSDASGYCLVPKILLCYWPTIQSSILHICPNFQVLSSQFSEVYELLNKHWANLSENISIPISVQCYNMYW